MLKNNTPAQKTDNRHITLNSTFNANLTHNYAL
jgi:hypothetical protein